MLSSPLFERYVLFLRQISAALRDVAAKMEVSEETVQKIQKFAQNRQAAEKESASEPLRATNLHAYTHRLDETLRELQEQVRRQEDELKKVRYLVEPLGGGELYS